MKNVVFGACMALAITAMVGAQDKKMSMDKMDHMAADTSYTGCLESSDGHFSLTHPMAADMKPMKKSGSMKKDDGMAMKKSDGMMKDDGMKKDGMMKDDGMKKDMMEPSMLSLTGGAVDLSKHVGHKVTVTGSEDTMGGMASFKVKSLKMIGKTCG
jgi:hypothetical protein